MCQKIVINIIAITGLLCLFSGIGWAMDGDVDADDTNDEISLQDYRHFALVIGNQNYEEGKLANPVNDAQAIKDFLLSRRFKEEDILYLENADLKTMESTMSTFIKRLRAEKNSIAFVYYSGHGVQAMNLGNEVRKSELTNYLIPVNNKRIQLASDLHEYSVSLNQLLNKLRETNQKGLNIVLMDACRNEWHRAFNRSIPNASFAPISAKGVFTVYATESWDSAADNSLFRKSFIEHAKQVKKLTDVFNDVKKAFALSETSQLPVIHDRTLGGDFYFTGGGGEDPKILEANYHLAKSYENKALLALIEGDKTKDITDYREAWLYGLEAQKLKMPEGHL